MRRIAVYGKGGIGKSTISANVSAALQLAGHSVVQIGCDPKHDSTRQLLGGRRITTALDYLKDARPGAYDVNAILHEGFAGVGCVEAGGPKPGVGCAGRGIISTFDLLAQFKLEDRYDIAIYDVLGDVVCGGFAVPIRREYADTILVVTSGEFMSLYAANNILRGIRNYDGDDHKRIAGIVLNRRNVEDEEGRANRFAQAVGLPLFVDVPRSEAFAHAERRHVSVVELNQDERLCSLFADMAARLAATDELALHAARPLSDEELERVVLGAAPAATGEPPATASGKPHATQGHADARIQLKPVESIDVTDPNRYLSKTLASGGPLHGCAFNGAIAAALSLGDAVVLAHAPRSCANLALASFSSSGRRALYERGELLPLALAPNLECTDMDEPQIVFGGTEALLNKVREVKLRCPRAVIVVSSCPSGIIGDDVDRVAALSDESCTVVPIRTDGNMTGDFMQGHIAAHLAIARTFVDASVKPRERTVNIIGEKPSVSNTQRNFEVVRDLLGALGVRVNCRFLNSTSVEELAGFCAGALNLPAYGDYTAQLLGKLVAEEFGGRVFERPFPVGFDETAQWVADVAEALGVKNTASQVIDRHRALYDEAVEQLRPQLSGKKLMVLAYNCELDWVLRTALDLDMQIVRIGILGYSQDEGFRTKLDVDLPVVENYGRADRADEVAALAPDVLLANYAIPFADRVPVADTIPMCPDVGFMSSVKLMQRWARLLRLRLKGGWKDDGSLFEESFL